MFAILGSFGMAIIYGFKVNLSVAIVAMVNQTALKAQYIYEDSKILAPVAQYGGLSLRCHRVTVYRDINNRRTSERTCRCRFDSTKVILSYSYYIP